MNGIMEPSSGSILSSVRSLCKSARVRVAFIVIFVLVNVILFMQSKHIILGVIFSNDDMNSSYYKGHRMDRWNDSNIFSTSSQYIFLNGSILTNVYHNVTTNTLTMTTKVNHEQLFFSERVVNPHDFRYIITPRVNCSTLNVELAICVAISHENFEGRKVIRDAWGSYAYNISNNAVLVFFIGTSSRLVNISQESLIYGDILQEDFVESYRNLSLKSVSILKWVSSCCSNAKFILKADDDMYVNIPFLIKTLREYALQNSNGFIVGSLQENAPPIRHPSSKWYTPISEFSGRTFPNYVSGTAYAMTSKAAFLLFEASLRLPIFWLEDVYITGLCARKASVQIYDSGYFSYGKPGASGCSFKHHISGHRYTHKEILLIHKELYDPSLKC